VVFHGSLACRSPEPEASADTRGTSDSMFNLAHLDYLGEDLAGGIRIVHIYSEAPDYLYVGDADEGIACVDDVARAAVVYLRHFELTGDRASLEMGKALVRFVMHMQSDAGLFYNFVFDRDLRINTTHQNSTADAFTWWAGRAVWALGTAARVLKLEDPEFSAECVERIRRTLPHLAGMLEHYGQTTTVAGREVPLWLVGEYASDATSEMMLGLVALREAYPDAYPDTDLHEMIARFSDGIARMQYGSMNVFPYAAHVSYPNEWHGWGNSQTQALAEAGLVESALREANAFYPRLLVAGWRHSMVLDDPEGGRDFEQIAYAVRGVAVGLARLHAQTGETRYATLAGLAASWFTGNNAAGVAMYDPETGRVFDGINDPETVNRNSGAESTIEGLVTVLEIEQIPEALRWLHARGGAVEQTMRDGDEYLYRVFSAPASASHADHPDASDARVGVVMNLTQETLELMYGPALDEFVALTSPSG